MTNGILSPACWCEQPPHLHRHFASTCHSLHSTLPHARSEDYQRDRRDGCEEKYAGCDVNSKESILDRHTMKEMKLLIFGAG